MSIERFLEENQISARIMNDATGKTAEDPDQGKADRPPELCLYDHACKRFNHPHRGDQQDFTAKSHAPQLPYQQPEEHGP